MFFEMNLGGGGYEFDSSFIRKTTATISRAGTYIVNVFAYSGNSANSALNFTAINSISGGSYTELERNSGGSSGIYNAVRIYEIKATGNCSLNFSGNVSGSVVKIG